jgi:hypothetical protein
MTFFKLPSALSAFVDQRPKGSLCNFALPSFLWHDLNMPKRSRTGKPDVNQMAANLIDAIADELPTEQPDASGKNPAAVALGRLGGLKGGKARAAKLSKRKLHAIAKKAAVARWSKS